MPSSMLMSITCAPFSTCSLAIESAASNSPFRISRANFLEPATFVLSPILMKFDSAVMRKGSSPLNVSMCSLTGNSRGVTVDTISAIALMWSGVVPQHPPTMLKNLASAKSLIVFAISDAVSSYSPNAFGRPAFG